jgi:hypothetical protein
MLDAVNKLDARANNRPWSGMKAALRHAPKSQGLSTAR